VTNLTRERVRHKALSLLASITGMVPGCVHGYYTRSLLTAALRGDMQCNDFPVGQIGRTVAGVLYPDPRLLSVAHYETRSVEECLERGGRLSVGTMLIKNRPCCNGQLSQVCDDSMLSHLSGEERRALEAQAGGPLLDCAADANSEEAKIERAHKPTPLRWGAYHRERERRACKRWVEHLDVDFAPYGSP